MSTNADLNALYEGTWVDGRYLPLSEVATCQRCGIQRRTNTGRITTGLCQDCWALTKAKTPTHHYDDINEHRTIRTKAGVVKFIRVPECCTGAPMCDECRDWAEKAADKAFWLRWERANRRARRNPYQAEAEARTARQLRRKVA